MRGPPGAYTWRDSPKAQASHYFVPSPRYDGVMILARLCATGQQWHPSHLAPARRPHCPRCLRRLGVSACPQSSGSQE